MYSKYYVNPYSPANALSFILIGENNIWEGIGTTNPAKIIATYSSTCVDPAQGASLGTPLNPNVLWVAYCKNVWFRNTAGARLTQTAYSFSIWGAATGVSADPASSTGNTAYVLSFREDNPYTGIAHVIKTTDGGGTWTNVTGDLNTKCPVNSYWPWDYWWNAIAVLRSKSTNNIVVYVGGRYGLWYAEDTGSPLSWSKLKEYPMVKTMEIKAYPTRDALVLSAFGRGVWVVFNATIPSSVSPSPSRSRAMTPTASKTVKATPLKSL